MKPLEEKTHMDPPRSLVLSVTTAEPTQTMTNTSANSGPPSLASWPALVDGVSPSGEPCSITASMVHRISGPHRSPVNETIQDVCHYH